MADLPINVDTAYADDTTDASVKLHQQHHDRIHAIVNTFPWDQVATWDNGAIAFWNTGTDKWEILDPAISGSPGPTGPPGADGISFVWQGVWTVGHAYVANDVVNNDRDTYICLTANTGSEPPSAFWELMAQGGADGAVGAAGATGLTGATGPAGPREEILLDFPALEGAVTLDFGSYSYVTAVLSDNATISFEDTSALVCNAMTIRLTMGSGGPYTITWPDVSRWIATPAGGSFGDPPDLSALVTDDLVVFTFDTVNGEIFGYVPGGGEASPPPPVTWPALAFEQVGATYTTNIHQGIDYTTSANYQIGNNRVGHVFVVNVCEASVTPVQPTLAGGGGSSWTALSSTVEAPTSATRRRLTHFICRDASSGPAAPFVIGVGGQATAAVICWVGRTTASPSTAVAVATANVHTGFASTAAVTGISMSAAAQAANRLLWAILDNSPATTLTPEANHVLVVAGSTTTGPTARLQVLTNMTAFDTTPTGTFSGATLWAVSAVELEDGS